jgi:hypothetical protein
MIKEKKKSGMEDKVDEILYSVNHKEKKCILRSQNVRTLGNEQKGERAETQMKVIFNTLIEESFPSLCNDIDTHEQEAFQTSN